MVVMTHVQLQGVDVLGIIFYKRSVWRLYSSLPLKATLSITTEKGVTPQLRICTARHCNKLESRRETDPSSERMRSKMMNVIYQSERMRTKIILFRISEILYVYLRQPLWACIWELRSLHAGPEGYESMVSYIVEEKIRLSINRSGMCIM